MDIVIFVSIVSKCLAVIHGFFFLELFYLFMVNINSVIVGDILLHHV